RWRPASAGSGRRAALRRRRHRRQVRGGTGRPSRARRGKGPGGELPPLLPVTWPQQANQGVVQGDAMSDVLTLTEIQTRFADEWVLVDEPQTDSVAGVQGGKVLAHSKDRDEVYRQAVALRPRRFAVIYTGVMPADTEIVPRLALVKLTALGQDRIDFPVLCHTLPPSATVDGLLGLDFLRGCIVTIDFQRGDISLA